MCKLYGKHCTSAINKKRRRQGTPVQTWLSMYTLTCLPHFTPGPKDGAQEANPRSARGAWPHLQGAPDRNVVHYWLLGAGSSGAQCVQKSASGSSWYHEAASRSSLTCEIRRFRVFAVWRDVVSGGVLAHDLFISLPVRGGHSLRLW